jgi:hypothetical protein
MQWRAWLRRPIITDEITILNNIMMIPPQIAYDIACVLCIVWVLSIDNWIL